MTSEGKSAREVAEQIESEMKSIAAALEGERTFLWEICPHDGKYGDDGEMQCRSVDFKRQEIYDCRQHVLVALQEYIAKLRSDAYGESAAPICECCNGSGIGSSRQAERDREMRESLQKALQSCIKDIEEFQERLKTTTGGAGGHGCSIPYSGGLLKARAASKSVERRIKIQRGGTNSGK